MELRYANILDRIYALSIDMFILLLIATPLTNIADSDIGFTFGKLITYIIALYCFLYSPILDCTGGTIGKRALGLKLLSLSKNTTPNIFNTFLRTTIFLIPILVAKTVIDESTNDLISGSKNSFIEFINPYATIVLFLFLILSIISLLAILWTKRRQSWSDYISSIVIVSNKKRILDPDIENQVAKIKTEKHYDVSTKENGKFITINLMNIRLKIWQVISIISFLILFFLNPSLKDFREFIGEKNVTKNANFLIFSIYKYEDEKYIGFLDNFIKISD